VGATNWFIRVPFMLEGMVQGLIGAGVAFLAVYFARNEIMKVVNDPSISAFTKLYATPGEAVMTGLLLLVVGAGVGALGSAVAVRRFLDV
jgi:cell division transport system permease protein